MRRERFEYRDHQSTGHVDGGFKKENSYFQINMVWKQLSKEDAKEGIEKFLVKAMITFENMGLYRYKTTVLERKKIARELIKIKCNKNYIIQHSGDDW